MISGIQYGKKVCGRIAADIKEYGMAGAALLLYTLVVNLVFHGFCPLVIFCGFPCPGCGVTRATACFVTGRWHQAWQLNPVIFPIAATAFYFGWNRYLLGRKAKWIKGLLILIFIMLVLVYVVRMYLYFPQQVPYVYEADNILSRFLPFYQQMIHEMGIL